MKKTEQIIDLLKSMFEDIDTSDFNIDTEFKNNDEWDSVTSLTLITLLDNEFNISISGEKIKELNTVKDLINYIDG
jgi:acyl carrier protein